MRKSARFIFNPENLSYVKYEPRFWERTAKFFAIGATLFIVALLSYSIYIARTMTPGEEKLKQQVDLYKSQVEILKGRLGKLDNNISELQKRDNQIYRIVFEADPLPSDIGATGGTDAYTDLLGLDGGANLVTVYKKLDELNAKAKVLTQSYGTLLNLAKQKQKFLSCMPAIQPVSNKDLSEIASGFGMRLHPVYKTLKMHEGLDFAAEKGSDVYATGDGVVEKVEYDGGYGKHVVIDHGFGYKTVYGHLSAWTVKRGQRVKRGELIGKVGSTGLSTGPHLHYEVEKNGKKINPVNYFHNDLTAAEYEKMVRIANQSNQSFD